MFKFDFLDNKNKIENKTIYVEEDYAFNTIPRPVSDIYLYVGYVGIGVNTDSNIVNGIDGYNHKGGWKKAILAVPDEIRVGSLVLSNELESGSSYRIDKDNRWETYYDENKDVVCIGDSENLFNSITVKISINVMLTLRNNELVSIWIEHPCKVQ